MSKPRAAYAGELDRIPSAAPDGDQFVAACLDLLFAFGEFRKARGGGDEFWHLLARCDARYLAAVEVVRRWRGEAGGSDAL